MRRASELIVVTVVLVLVAAAGRSDGAEPRLVTERGGRQMYVITDKPLYRPGETIWFRSWELLVLGFAPVASEHAVTFDLVDPKGAVVATRKVRSTGGLAANDIALPPDLAGGR